MINSRNKFLLALLALFAGTLIGSFGPYFSKVILRELPPLTVLFLRLIIMVGILTPLLFKRIHTLTKKFKQLIVLGLFLSGNLIFFIVGIRSSTVLASGVLYAGVPISVLFFDKLINHEKLTKEKGVSILMAFFGALIILYSSKRSYGLGEFNGTVLLFIATASYALYLVYSKHLSFHIEPIELTWSTAVISLVITFIAMIFFEGASPLSQIFKISFSSWISLIYLGIFLGVIMYFLIQWGVRYGSALLAASMQYVAMILTGLSGILLLNEHLTTPFIIGSLFIVLGLYFIVIYPALRRER